MDQEQFYKNFLKWASENDENKHKAINTAISLIGVLNNTSKKLTDEEINKIVGGLSSSKACSAIFPV